MKYDPVSASIEQMIREKEMKKIAQDFDEGRIDTIGQNGNDGDHYEVTADEEEAFKAMETMHNCRQCGGAYHTPPHDECPCIGEAEGRKDDSEKPMAGLLSSDMPLAMLEVARVMTFGAKKYAPGNWQHVPDGERRYLDASWRHELARASGEAKDAETGYSHLAHKICCDMFRLELELRNQGGKS